MRRFAEYRLKMEERIPLWRIGKGKPELRIEPPKVEASMGEQLKVRGRAK